MSRKPTPQPLSFTTSFNGLTNVLWNETVISSAYLGNPPPGLIRKEYKAIWDTGATGTAITKQVAQECQLLPTGMTQVRGVQSTKIVNTYLVNILLRNSVEVAHVRVTECDSLGGDADVLIGMDIITRGDFAVTNKDGKTTFSFRVPSAEKIDFVANPPGSYSQTPAEKGKKGSTRRKKKNRGSSGKKW